MRPDRPQQPGGPVQLVRRPEEHHHPAEPVLEAAACLDSVEYRGEQGTWHEHARHLLPGDGVEQHVGVEGLVVQEHAAGAAHVVGVESLEAAGPLDGVEMQVDVVGLDRRDTLAEGVEVVQVVVDDRLPRPVRLDPCLGMAGCPRGELEEARGVLVDVEIGILAGAAGLQLPEGRRPGRAVSADSDKVADGLELVPVALDLLGEARVKDED